MDPATISFIITALASGAIFVTSAVVEEEVQANYRSLKVFVGEKFGLQKSVVQLENIPTQENQKLLAEDLADVIEAQEIEIIDELINKTKALTESLEKVSEKLSKQDFDAIGIDLENVKAINVKINNVISEGGAKVLGIKARNLEADSIDAGDIIAKK
ncbi:MAG: hypothetical protein F6K50_02825 [Moorea sp. SIO3I7]|uniref:hypothetical protein n=1 Tax=Moorena sp. SIO3I8 TaxID=2607833 RepID=UPI0013C08FB3|nr:hypothetical protein [Moorena sp. SIO3I8]NEN94496.1 hypothetical protein [Moorena sp. SIO3I7]NEO07406.1 hypothetical protein [Moorena sp. SIO3I8]